MASTKRNTDRALLRAAGEPFARRFSAGSRNRPKTRLWWSLKLQMNGKRNPSEGFETTSRVLIREGCERVRRILFAVSLTLIASSPAMLEAADDAVREAEQRRVATVERVSPSVTAIFGVSGEGGGSGVVISPDGYALSNFHVTGSVGDFMKCGLNDGVLYDAVIVGVDPTGDVALLKLLGRDDFPAAELGDSDAVRTGDWVYVIGNPFLLATDFQPTVTYGIVSGIHRYQYPAGTFLEYADCIQVDASINPGNSGGPLFNAAGQLIGINGRGSFEKRGRVNVGAGYAISINQIKHFMGHLRGGRIVDHATLGATVATRPDGTVFVDDILEESDAYRRGLRVNDELFSFASRPIRSVNQFKNILGIYPQQWKLPLSYRRDNETHDIHVRLRSLHRTSEMTPSAKRMKRPVPPKRPDGKQPKPDPHKPPRKPGPNPHGSQKAQPPEEYKHMLVEKPGFANYYFNTVEQKRTLKAIQALGDFSDVLGQWRVRGTTDNNLAFEFILDEALLGLSLGKTDYVQEMDKEPIDEPAGTGGLLMAMHHLKLLLSRGAPAFTEFFYAGREPLSFGDQPVDVLYTLLAGVETRWYVTSGGTFVGFDTRLSPDLDECEVRFAELTEWEGRRFPQHIRVTSGETPFAEFHVQGASFLPAPNQPEPVPADAEEAGP